MQRYYPDIGSHETVSRTVLQPANGNFPAKMDDIMYINGIAKGGLMGSDGEVKTYSYTLINRLSTLI